MRFKAELLPSVYSFLQHWCTAEERDDFSRKLLLVREDPIGNSEMFVDTESSPGHVLHCFKFGRGVPRLAVFDLDAYRRRIKILKCRLSQQQRRRGADDDPARPDI